VKKIFYFILFGLLVETCVCYADATVTGAVSSIRAEVVGGSITTTVTINTTDINPCNGLFSLYQNSGQMITLLMTAGNMSKNLTISYTSECNIFSATIE